MKSKDINKHLIVIFGGLGKLGSYISNHLEYDISRYKLIILDISKESTINLKNKEK